MKKILTIFSLFSFILVFSQNNIAKRIQEVENQKSVFRKFQVLNVSPQENNTTVNSVVTNATFASINLASVNEIVENKPEYIELEIPYNNSSVTVLLYKVELFAADFHVDTDKVANVSYEKGVYYRGIVKGNQTSVASINFFKNEFNGIVSSSDLSNLVIGKLDKPNNTLEYIVYADKDLKISNDFQCAVKDEKTEHSVINNQDGNRDISSTKCVTMYFELDFNLFTSNGSNITTTTNWLTSVFNNVQTLYTNDGITISLKSMFIWTTQDPYTGSTSSDYLFQFNSIRPVFDGDVGQLLGIDPGGLGGVAVGINGICSQYNFSYSDVSFSFNTVPTYSFTILVIAHEFGHLLGSRHTHSCSWNGNNTAIDGCGQQAGFPEGNCATGPIPSSTVKGTIMSYCHLVSGVGINFNNGFGPQPTARILNSVNSGQCLSTDCINTCINTIAAITINSVTTTTAQISWPITSGYTSWQIAVYPFSSSSSSFTTISTNSFTATGLFPNTYYVVEVRPTCSNSLVSSTRKIMFVTSTNYCSGVTITDTGGASGNYTNEQESIRIMIPQTAGQAITLTFSAFSLELNYDYIYVYNGNSTNATLMNVGGSTGTTIPGPFTSTASDGSLTLRFFSDQGVVDSGFIATTSCATLGNASNSFIDFTYFPNPSTDIVTINSKTNITSVTVYNIAGQLLFTKNINDLNTQVDISKYANGTYFFKLKFDEKEVNFKILKI